MFDFPEPAVPKGVRRAWAITIAGFALSSIGCFSTFSRVDPVIDNTTDSDLRVRLLVGDQFRFESVIPAGGSMEVSTPSDFNLDWEDQVRVEASMLEADATRPVVATSTVGQDRAEPSERNPTNEFRPRYIVRTVAGVLVIDRVQKSRYAQPTQVEP